MPQATGQSPFHLSWLERSRSPIGKKLLTGITGLPLAGFVGVHMLGNLLLLVSPAAFNDYGNSLETTFKPLVWGVELGLGVAIALHAALGIQIYIAKRKARPIAYASYKSVNQVRGQAEQTGNQSGNQTGNQTDDRAIAPHSFQTLSSRTMIGTGITLAAFIVWHLVTFKLGSRYEIVTDGHAQRDLARLVIETFQQPFYTFSYLGLMALLGLHLRHGLWSALQSLGALGKGMQAVAFGASLLGAGAIAAGFGVLPIAIFCGWIR
ncbi:MAG: succinate dehydrogenase [Synechococcales cyanobacterium RU_4_20]|nr:succinate dehydrogenase [Synechococcales cyanobacterium RU_4_20]NJR68048.1 succinate dehydrogenase [Synechococcales cyanobacterium CRU_2_2]